MKNVTLLSLAVALAPVSARAELVELYFENTAPATASFTGGEGNADFLSVTNGSSQPVGYSVSFADQTGLIGLSGSYQASFQIGDVAFFGTGQRSVLTSLNGLFTLNDGLGGVLTGQISEGELFRTTRTMDLKFDVTNLVYSGSSASVSSLLPMGSLSVELPLYFDTSNPSLVALKQSGLNSQGWLYDGYLETCAAPIPETPWFAAVMGLFAAAIAYRQRSSGTVAV